VIDARKAPVAEFQSGIVTFLFTDIEGSTRLWEADPDAMSAALRRHDVILRGAIEEAGGSVFKTVGDAFCAVFPAPVAAITAAVAAQRALIADTPGMTVGLKVRIAIHAGHAEPRGGDYFGPPLNRIARLLATAHGEQIVVSRAARELTGDQLPPEMTLRDLGEHTLKDLQQAERVYQVVAPGLRADFPPLRTASHFLRNIPHATTPLIGRQAEVAVARAAIVPEPSATEPGARLLTLTGPGGTGKTRLALHLATTLGVGFDDGAAFVPLADIGDPTLAPSAIAAALELGDLSGESPRAILLEQLRDRHLLLVLDNLEQVLGVAPFVAELLTQCRRLRVLATSREPLHLRGERELPLPPLALPPRRGAVANPAALDQIEQSDAVRLFVERAQAVKPNFTLAEENAAEIGEICHRLDGLPLAIELAAARVKFLPPRAMLERFDRRLDLLSRGPRDLPDRQRTMRDTVAWSFDLLDPEEQRLFSAVSVFAGGATLAACAAVCADCDGDDALPDLDRLESLSDKSLIRLTPDDDEPRVTLLQTIRDYGLERLAERDDSHAIGERHARYFLALAEELEPLLAGRDQARWLDALERERANLRAAVAWLRDDARTEEALRLAGALWRFWWLRGDVGEGRQQLEALLCEGGEVAPQVRAKALNGAGVLAESHGDWAAAITLHEESLDISRQLGDRRGVAWSLNNLGVVAINQGDFARARELLEENLAVAEQADEPASVATALLDLGQIAHFGGDHDRAAALFTRSLTLARRLGDDSQIARALNNLGTVALEQGGYERARSLLSESLDLLRRVGDRQGIASTLNNLAEVASSLGDPQTAMGLYLEGHMLALEGGNTLYAAIAMGNLAALTLERGDLSVAQTRFREALALFHIVGDHQGMIDCLSGLASVATRQGRHGEAAMLLGAVAAICAHDEQLMPPNLAEAAAALRAAMGDGSFEDAWQTGKSAPRDDLIELVIAQRHMLELLPAR
jgi:predicted ATPase/class 3 adenylate cyclase